MPSAAAGNSRLRGLALHLTRMGTPHYVTLGEALTTTASRGPAPLPAQPLWAQPRGLQPTHVSGFFALSSRPHDRLRSCPEPGAVCSKQRGAASSEGAVWGARRGGREEAPRAGPCGVTWVQRPGWTDQPCPSWALSEPLTEEGRERPVLGGVQGARLTQTAPSPATPPCLSPPHLASPRLPPPPCSLRLCQKQSEWVRPGGGGWGGPRKRARPRPLQVG